MTHSSCSRFCAASIALVIACLPSSAAACTACMGDANSKTGGAMNAAIFLMLGFIGGVLGLLVAFGYSLMKRANAPLPPHAEFSNSGSDTHANS